MTAVDLLTTDCNEPISDCYFLYYLLTLSKLLLVERSNGRVLQVGTVSTHVSKAAAIKLATKRETTTASLEARPFDQDKDCSLTSTRREAGGISLVESPLKETEKKKKKR